MEDIDYLFMNCVFVQVPNTIVSYCPAPGKSLLNFIDWIDHVRKNENVYNKLCQQSIDKVFVMAWSIWTYKNNVLFRKHSAHLGHIINSTLNLFEDMRYYNVLQCVWPR